MKTTPLRLRIDSITNSATDTNVASGTSVVSGTVSSGRVAISDRVKILPEAITTRISRLRQNGINVDYCEAGQSAELVFDTATELHVGSVVCATDDPVEVADQFEVEISWQDGDPLLAGRPYSFGFGSFFVTGSITNIKYKLHDNQQIHLAATTLENGEHCIATISVQQPIAFTAFEEDNILGAFSIIEQETDNPQAGKTLGVGEIKFALRRASNIHRQALDLDRHAHAAIKRQKPCVLWLTGLSGSGKSTIANALESRLHDQGRHTFLLDGDNVRHGLNRDLGFTDADRVENIRRVSEVARLMSDAGLIVITSFISPFISERQMARELMPEGEFFEIFVDAPLAVCEKRDEKGLYAKARAGLIKNFTGIDSAYEPPAQPEISVDTTSLSPDQAAEVIIEFLQQKDRLT